MFYRTVKNELYSDITLPSLFLDMFIPIASGDQLKVFLLGYREAFFYNGLSREELDNQTIANSLNLTEEQVVDAWKFWENMGVVKIHSGISTDSVSIEFLDIRYEHLKIHSNIDDDFDDEETENSSDDDYLNMFEEIESISGRIFTPNEKLDIMEAIESFDLNCELAIEAFKKAVENTGKIKSIAYVRGIMKSWFDNSIKSIEDLEIYDIESNKKNELYREVLSRLGISRKKPTSYEEEIMSGWIEKYDMDKEMILTACSKTINTNAPSIKYIDGIIKSWSKAGIRTIEDVQAEEERFNRAREDKKRQTHNKSPRTNSGPAVQKKTAFHNYKEGISSQYSPEELTNLVRELNKK